MQKEVAGSVVAGQTGSGMTEACLPTVVPLYIYYNAGIKTVGLRNV